MTNWKFRNGIGTVTNSIEYEETLVAHGLRIVGVSPDNNFVEVVEVEIIPGLWVASFTRSSNPSP
jgi:CTP synthase (UTP-ammonia lyase)